MSIGSRAYKFLCRQYRLVLSHMRWLEWLRGHGLFPAPAVEAAMEPLEPRLLLSAHHVSGTTGDDTIVLTRIDETSVGVAIGSSQWTLTGVEQGDTLEIDGAGGTDSLAVTLTGGPALAVHLAGGSFTLGTDAMTGVDALELSSGVNATINAAQDLDSITLDGTSAATFNTDLAADPDDPQLALTLNGSSHALFNATQHLASLTLNDSSTATLGLGHDKLIRTGSLSIETTGGESPVPTAALDLMDGAMIVEYTGSTSPLDEITTWVAAGFDGGLWDCHGIMSTLAAKDPMMTVGVGPSDNSVEEGLGGYTEFHGETGLTGDEVLLATTYYGDVLLEGTVTYDGYWQWAYGFTTPGVTGWMNGDFNYDGLINYDDYYLWVDCYGRYDGAMTLGGTSGDDAYYIQSDPTNGDYVDIWKSSTTTTPTGSPDYLVEALRIATLTVGDSGGTDTYIIDTTNGVPVSAYDVVGSVVFTTDLGVAGGSQNPTVTVNNGGDATFEAPQHLACLTLNGNAQVTFHDAVNLTAADTVDEGADYTLQFFPDSPFTGFITQWQIDWGDGSGVETVLGSASAATHIYQIPDPDVESVGYEVQATAWDGYGAYAAPVHTVTVWSANVPTPSDLAATADETSHDVTLTWSGRDDASYTISRTDSHGDAVTRVATGLTFTDAYSNLAPGETYTYAVSPAGPLSLARWSNEAIITAARQVPDAPVVTYSLDQGTPEFQWEPVNGATGYRVYRTSYTKGGDAVLIATLEGSATEFRDTIDRDPSQTYLYNITAIAPGVESASSDEITVLRAPGSVVLFESKDPDTGATTIKLGWTTGYVFFDPVEPSIYHIYELDGTQKNLTLTAGQAEDNGAWCEVTIPSTEADPPPFDHQYVVTALTEPEEEGGQETEGQESLPTPILTAEAAIDRVSLDWGSVADADRYDVYRSFYELAYQYPPVTEIPVNLESGQPYQADVGDTAPDGRLTYDDFWMPRTNSTNANWYEHLYRYEVQAASGSLLSASQVYVDYTYPVTPVSLSANVLVSEGAAEVTLLWSGLRQGPYAGLTYSVFRSTTPTGPCAEPIASGLPAGYYLDGGLPLDGTDYYYWVTQTLGQTESLPSDRLRVVLPTVPAAPQNLKVLINGWFDSPYSYRLYWDPVPGATGYKVCYGGQTASMGIGGEITMDPAPTADVPFSVWAVDGTLAGAVTEGVLPAPAFGDWPLEGAFLNADTYVARGQSAAFRLVVNGAAEDVALRLVYQQASDSSSPDDALTIRDADDAVRDSEQWFWLSDGTPTQGVIYHVEAAPYASVGPQTILFQAPSAGGGWMTLDTLTLHVIDFAITGGDTIPVDSSDADGDGIPDYADGFNRDGVKADALPPGDDDLSPGLHFTPIQITFSDSVDPEKARIQLDYSAADPEAMYYGGSLPDSAGTWPLLALPAGCLRLWTRDNDPNVSRSTATSLLDPGDGVSYYLGLNSDDWADQPTRGWYAVEDLPYTHEGGSYVITLYAEGVVAGVTTLTVKLNPYGARETDGHTLPKMVYYLNVAPTYVPVNDDDSNQDTIPDYAEPAYSTSETYSSEPTDFVQVAVSLPYDVEGQIEVDYASAGLGATRSGDGTSESPYIYAPATGDGYLRLWTRNDSLRTSNDYLDSGSYAVGQSGRWWGQSIIYLFVEAVRHSGDPQQVQFTFIGTDGSESVLATFNIHIVPRPNLLIDADNDNGFDATGLGDPADQATKYLAGFDQAYPGKIIPVNDGDIDNDGVPDYADGFNLDRVSDTDPQGKNTRLSSDDDFVSEWQTSGTDAGKPKTTVAVSFTPIVLKLPDGIDLSTGSTARFKLVYDDSDPAGVVRQGHGTQGDPYVYTLPVKSCYGGGTLTFQTGVLRLWTAPVSPADGVSLNNRRTAQPFWEYSDTAVDNALGFFVPSTSGDNVVAGADDTRRDFYTYDDLVNMGLKDDRTITLYAEGIVQRVPNIPTEIRVEVDPDGGGPAGYVAQESVYVTVGYGNLVVAPVGPQPIDDASQYWGTPYDKTEDVAGMPGGILLVNDADQDRDAIPDFAEGFTGGAGDGPARQSFLPVQLQLPYHVDLSTARFSFDYSGSDPMAETQDDGLYAPAVGSLRIWRSDGQDRASSDYLRPFVDGSPETTYLASDLGMSADNLYVTFYVEAVRPSQSLGDLRIVAYIHPNGGTGAKDRALMDAVRLTALQDTNADASDYSGPVRYSDGTVNLDSTDLVLDNGIGGPWTVSRLFSTQPGLALGELSGDGVASDTPSFLLTARAAIIQTGDYAQYFDFNPNETDPKKQFTARFDNEATLVRTKQGITSEYTLTEADGSQWWFNDLLQPKAATGLYADPAGRISSPYGWEADPSAIWNLVETAAGHFEGTCYDATDADADSLGLLKNMALKQLSAGDNSAPISEWDDAASTTVRQVTYTYYQRGDQYGDVGDLKTVTISDATGRAIGTTYYRYVPKQKPTDPTLLAMVIGPDGYERYLANHNDIAPSAVNESDSELAPYADYLFTYYTAGANKGRVRHLWVQGAGGHLGSDGHPDPAYSFYYTYEDSSQCLATDSPATGFNVWARGTTETLPHGTGAAVTIKKVYTNFAGQVMLTDVNASPGGNADTQDWYTYTRYDDCGRATMVANPSAVDYIDGSSPGLASLKSNDGLVLWYDYGAVGDEAAATGDTAGWAPGRLSRISVSNGEQGGRTDQETFSYAKFTQPAAWNGNADLYLVTSDTVCNEGTSSTTTYGYGDWLKCQPRTITTHLPPVSSEHHGDGTSATETTVLDDYGRVVWQQNAGGYLQYFEYDAATGAVTKSIVDAYASLVVEPSRQPPTYTISSDAPPANLVTATEVDSFGRPVKVTDPDGHVTSYSYVDSAAKSEIVANFPDGTSQEVIDYRDQSIVDTLTFAQGQTALLSLSRSRLDPSGRTASTDSYFNLDELAYAAPTPASDSLGVHLVNYTTTSYEYDALGLLTKTTDELGANPGTSGALVKTVTQTVYDGLGRPIRTDFGPENQLVQVSATEYDNGGVGDGNVTKAEQFYASSGSYDTRYFTDFRDRLVCTVTPDHVATCLTLDNLGEVKSVETYANALDCDGNLSLNPENLRSRTEALYDEQGRVYLTQVDGIDQANGQALSDFLATQFWYDARGHLVAEKDPTLLVSTQAFDGAGRVTESYVKTALGTVIEGAQAQFQGTHLVSTSVGTDATAAHSQTTAVVFYDGKRDGTGTPRPAPTGVSVLKAASQATFTLPTYEGVEKGKEAVSIAADGTETRTLYDALGRATSTKTYRGTTLLAEAENVYSGFLLTASRVYDVENGTAGAYEETTYEYDPRGNLSKVTHPGGSITQTDYSAYGVLTGTALKVGTAAVESTVPYYDAAGRVWETVQTSTGDAGATRTTTAATWYDDLGRIYETVDYGTGDGPESAALLDSPTSGAPGPSYTNLDITVTRYGYDGLGRQDAVTDNVGRTTKTFYDSAGREAYVVENWTDFTPGYDSGACDGTRHDQDIVTEYTYNDAGQVKQEIAWNRDASGSLTFQKTSYLYAADIPDNANHPGLKYGGADYRNVLRAVVYPDGPDASAVLAAFEEGDLGDHDFVEYTYYLDGSVATMTDQRGVVHTYGYDINGREVSDAVTTLPDGVDGSVRRIEHGYDDQGRLARVTSYDSPSGGTAVNEVRYDYDAWGDLTAIWQNHDRNVDKIENPSPKVAFGYEDAGGAPVLSTVTYPEGRVIHYNYSSFLDEDLSRPSSVSDGTSGPAYATFGYLGASTIVGETRPSVGLGYSLLVSGGLDALGRVTDLWWTLDGATVDEFSYGYDASGTRTWRAEYDGSAGEVHDEAYQYDGLNRLIDTKRGTLSQDENGQWRITDPSLAQSWALDALGNWDGFTTGTSTQTRTENNANEIISASGWITPLYDAAGNMTLAPKPGDEAALGGTRLLLTYDAWNRLVKVQFWKDADADGVQDSGEVTATVATYRYDGLGERIAKTLADGTRFDYYYNENWQVLEVRKNGTPYEQYLWDPAYVDAPIMRWRNADGNASNGLEEVVYYTSDANHNVTALVDAAGEVVERYIFDSYGAVTILSGDWDTVRTTSAYANNRLHAGEERDAETGLDNSRGRFYACWLGVFIQSDPAKADPNTYRYCGNRPIMATDPSGLSLIFPGRIGSNGALGQIDEFPEPNPDLQHDAEWAALLGVDAQWVTGARRSFEGAPVGSRELESMAERSPGPRFTPSFTPWIGEGKRRQIAEGYSISVAEAAAGKFRGGVSGWFDFVGNMWDAACWGLDAGVVDLLDVPARMNLTGADMEAEFWRCRDLAPEESPYVSAARAVAVSEVRNFPLTAWAWGDIEAWQGKRLGGVNDGQLIDTVERVAAIPATASAITGVTAGSLSLSPSAAASRSSLLGIFKEGFGPEAGGSQAQIQEAVYGHPKLANVAMRSAPVFDPYLKTYGATVRVPGERPLVLIGPKSFFSEEELIDSIVHEELHVRIHWRAVQGSQAAVDLINNPGAEEDWVRAVTYRFLRWGK